MYGQNNSIWDDIKYQFYHGNIVMQLIWANIFVFVGIGVVNVLNLFLPIDIIEAVRRQFILPSLGLELLKRPWTLISYMFTHFGLMHILFNMLIMYWFSRVIIDFIGENKILPIYILGGMAGGLLYVMLYTFVPVFSEQMPSSGTLGASASVLAIVVAAATIAPNYEFRLLFFGVVKLKFIALFMVVLDFISIPTMDGVNHVAHLGGAFFGYFFIKQLQNGKDYSIPFYKVWDYFATLFKKKERRPKVAYKAKRTNAKSSKVKVKASRKTEMDATIRQEKIDEILDKIARSGYDSLSKEEKEYLFRVSKEN